MLTHQGEITANCYPHIAITALPKHPAPRWTSLLIFPHFSQKRSPLHSQAAPTSQQNFPHFTPKFLTSATKVDATALFVKTMYVVFKNNADVYKNNAVASTFFAYPNFFDSHSWQFPASHRPALHPSRNHVRTTDYADYTDFSSIFLRGRMCFALGAPEEKQEKTKENKPKQKLFQISSKHPIILVFSCFLWFFLVFLQPRQA